LTLLVGRQEGHLACKKQEWWCTGVVIYLERGADLHMAQLMPLPLTVSCSSKILSIPIRDSNRFDSLCESIRFVKKIGLSIH